MSDIEQMDSKQLATVSALAARARELELKIENLQGDLAVVNEQYRKIVEDSLPTAMEEMGLRSLSLEDGSSIEVRDIINAGITDDKRHAAFSWLRANGLGDLIKNEVKAVFGRGEDAAAAELVNELRLRGCQWSQKEAVHPGTLKKQVREAIESGNPMPEELFGVHQIHRAQIIRGA